MPNTNRRISAAGPATDAARSTARSAELLYALAFLGAHIAFMPFLALLMPRRVAHLPGIDTNQMLGLLLILGGVTASLANIAAGHASDTAMVRAGNRRRTIATGAACVALSYAWLSVADAPWSLAVGVVGLQIAVNVLFAPVGVLLADYIPDHRKGRLSGLLNCATPIALALVAAVAWVARTDGIAGYAVTLAMVLVCVLPLILAWPFSRGTTAAATGHAAPVACLEARPPGSETRRNLVLVWIARCLMQLGATIMVYYLYPTLTVLLRDHILDAALSPAAAVGWLSLLAGAGACVGALALGTFSDLMPDRRKPLAVAAVLAGAGVLLVAQSRSWAAFAGGYVLFHSALAAFLAVEGALLAEIVALRPARGQLMGYMNLANTLPSVIGAALTIGIHRDLPLLAGMRLAFYTSAAGCLIAGGVVFAIRQRTGRRCAATTI